MNSGVEKMAKILLTAINAKYIHSNLAVYSLKAAANQYFTKMESRFDKVLDDTLVPHKLIFSACWFHLSAISTHISCLCASYRYRVASGYQSIAV